MIVGSRVGARAAETWALGCASVLTPERTGGPQCLCSA